MDRPSTGRLGRTHHESTPWFDAPVRPRAGAPNVLVILFDDTGFADFGCYGSEMRTPTIDALAAGGLRYANFHTTTLCSPTRACLLTGRNHHAVGVRFLANFDMGWPSGRGTITPRAATLAEMLRDIGYSTSCVGKWHLAPMNQTSGAGPFHNWPLGRGFDRFYGFLDGGTDQFYPDLARDNHRIEAPRLPEQGYHLTEDLIDNAITYLSDHISIMPDQPFFLYLPLGATHFPHHAPAASIARYAGQYDVGWEEIRRRRFEKQKALGIVPKDTVLPPINPGPKPWSALSADERRLSARFQEAYAGFLDHTDEQLGRLMAFLRKTGVVDDTLIMLLSDNGASGDGGPDGSAHISRRFNDLTTSAADNLPLIDKIGLPDSYPAYPTGWAQASNAPLRWYKQNTHGGGVRDPLIVHWPARIKDGGAIRHQFHHVIDLAPTVLELAGIAAPSVYRGVAQIPIHGVSMAYTFDQPAAPTRKDVQYFEMFGHRAIWHQGWKAVTRHTPGSSFDDEAWELYHLDADFSESRDLAKDHPAKLRELIERWWAEAGKYDVLPLDDRGRQLFFARPAPGMVNARKRFVYYPDISTIPPQAAPPTQGVSYSLSVEIERKSSDEQGILVAYGSARSGYALFIKDNRLVHGTSYCGEPIVLTSRETLPAGPLNVGFAFTRTGKLSGIARLLIDGRVVGEQTMDRTLARISLESLRIGRSAIPPVVPDYQGRFAFNGTIHRVVYELADDHDPPPA
jgi:arylsulfatase A-like enzyme